MLFIDSVLWHCVILKDSQAHSFFFLCSEPFIVFSGGLSYDKACRRPSLTIMHGKAITVLEMDHPIVEFLTLCETPYPNGKYLSEIINVEKSFLN